MSNRVYCATCRYWHATACPLAWAALLIAAAETPRLVTQAAARLRHAPAEPIRQRPAPATCAAGCGRRVGQAGQACAVCGPAREHARAADRARADWARELV